MIIRGLTVWFFLTLSFSAFGQAGFEYSTRYFNSTGAQTKYEHTQPQILVTQDSSLLAYGEVHPVIGTICPNPQNQLPCNQSIFLQKLTPNGDLDWRMIINGARTGCILSIDGIAKVIEASNGDIMVWGYTAFGSNCAAPEPQFLLARISASGSLIWKKLLIATNSPVQRAKDLVETRDGGFILIAHTDGGINYGSDIAVIKTDAQGTVEWSRTVGYSPGSEDRPEHILEFPDGYLLTGTKISGVFPAQTEQAYFVKLDTLGNKVWSKRMGNNNRTYELTRMVKLDNNRFLAGGTYNSTRNFILKMDRSGNIQQLLYTPVGQGAELLDILPGGQFIFKKANDQIVAIDTLNNLLWSNTIPGLSGIAYLADGNGYAMSYTEPVRYWDFVLSRYFDQNSLVISQTDSLGKNLCQNIPGGSGFNWLNSNHSANSVNNDHVVPVAVVEVVPSFTPLYTQSDPNDGICRNVCDTLPAVFTINSLPLCQGDTVQISNNSSQDYTSFSWYLGGLFLGNGREPALVASNPGVYTLKMVADGALCRDSIEFTYNVNGGVAANFAASPNFQNVQFFNYSSGANVYSWDFGDGNTSTTASPQHFYNTPGTYTVCLESTGPCGTDTLCRQVTAACQTPSANFGTTVSNLFVSFSDSSLNTNAWMWDFGDGNTAVGPNPAYVYQQGGTYQVCLIAMNNCGSDTICQMVSVGCNAPVAGFAYSNNDTIYQFISTSTISGSTTYLWDFGDGNTSNSFNPVHVYAGPGNYTVCLYLGGNCGTDTTCQSVSVTCPAPAADFNWAWSGSTCTFTDISVGGANWLWNFGDGNSSSQQNPQHTYSQSGNYQVCLSIVNPCGSDNICNNISLCAVEADFNVFSSNYCVGDTLIVGNSTTGANTYQWLLNGAPISNQAWVEPVIQNPGFNLLQLVGGDGICTDTASFEFSAFDVPDANFTAAATGTQVNFMDQSIGSPISWFWDFGDGNSSSLINPVHTYQQEDTFFVCLTVTNANGCEDVWCDSVVAVLTGRNAPKMDGLSLYPNPAENSFFLKWEGGPLKNARIQLFNEFGQVVLRSQQDLKSGHSLEFATETLARGMYLLQIQGEGRVYSHKLVLH